MLSKERLEEEIKNTKETNERLEQIRLDSIAGVEINNIVIQAFENARDNSNEGK